MFFFLMQNQTFDIQSTPTCSYCKAPVTVNNSFIFLFTALNASTKRSVIFSKKKKRMLDIQLSCKLSGAPQRNHENCRNSSKVHSVQLHCDWLQVTIQMVLTYITSARQKKNAKNNLCGAKNMVARRPVHGIIIV